MLIIGRGTEIALALSIMSPPVQSHRPDLNSFLNYRVHSTAQLVREVDGDSEVRDRFMRHFAMTRSELDRYLGSLHLARLEKTGVYKVYSVPDNKVLKMHLQTIKQGEEVFEDSAGTPVLLVRCGNPLSRGPNNPLTANNINSETEGTTNDQLAALKVPEENAEAENMQYVNNLQPGVPEAPTGGGSAAPFVPSGGGGVGALPFGLLAGLPFLFGHGGGGGHGSVPEPVSLIVLGVGVAGLIARRKRR